MIDETKIMGLGATPHARGAAFRVWASNAQRWQCYSQEDFEGHPSTSVVAELDGSAVIFNQRTKAILDVINNVLNRPSM